jgi:hypothetical protein
MSLQLLPAVEVAGEVELAVEAVPVSLVVFRLIRRQKFDLLLLNSRFPH